MNPLRLAPWPLVLSLVLSAVTVACNGSAKLRPEQDVDWLVRHARYDEAVRVAAEQADKHPDDPQRAEAWRLASVAWRLERGRRLTFRNEDVEALVEFRHAEELAPESPQVQAWVAASLDKLAGRWVDRAIAAHAAEGLEEAVRCYEVALSYRPDDRLAVEGLARALLQLNYRRGMGDTYYERGIRALNEFWLEQAAHHFSSTLKYHEHPRAEQRGTQTATLRAENRALIALDLEEAGQYAAARNEYRIAMLFDPSHAEALAGYERMKIEERAAEQLREADRRMLKGDFDGAEAALVEGEALTQRQQAAFAAERERVIDARLAFRYEAVRAIESDHRYEEAIAGYDALLASSSRGYFRDVIARRDALLDFVARAQAYYEQAMASDDMARRAMLLRQALLVHPDFKDAPQRLAEAERAAAAASDDGNADGGAVDDGDGR